MFKSEMYKKHFPIIDTEVRFTEEEKDLLCKWTRRFILENQARNCMGRLSYNIGHLPSESSINSMIRQNELTFAGCVLLNLVLYRNKYNRFLSFFLWPWLTEREVERWSKK